ncbi:aminotransferase-like domain-containing protein [Planococcus lenghuensis]|uniref:HTH gntR-type domain-containing protein n=1 Tax=Planococcus lenghuensis TaxID=2213202 RepID=A0A1Q2L2F9_9BACL|nr:PLP-dependent aminotransferase family protein [Planococcus lenghuensis]AQQ54648.1 hypothetical protein B0X71_17080 [Planococcus lenghuensis]
MRKTKHRQLVDLVKGKISDGEWAIGSMIPSQRDLAKRCGMNRSTVVAALDELKADGLLRTITGKGTIVANNSWTLRDEGVPLNWISGLLHRGTETAERVQMDETGNKLIRLDRDELVRTMFPARDMQVIMRGVLADWQGTSAGGPNGDPVLRKAICNHLKEKGIQTSPESVLVTSGATQALHLITTALVRPGEMLITEDPSPLSRSAGLRDAGMRLVRLPVDEAGLRPESLPPYEKRRAVLYAMPAFQNPTGSLMPEERRAELIRLGQREQISIIEDDSFGDLWIDSPPPLSLKTRDTFGNVLYIGSLSQVLGPDFRIGWTVGPKAVIDRLAAVKAEMDGGTSLLQQLAAAKWLASELHGQHLDYLRRQLRLRREVALEALEEHLTGRAVWTEPAGGYYIWVRVNPDSQDRLLFQKAQAKGIAVSPGNGFTSRPGQTFRLSYSLISTAEIRKGIALLGQILK